MSHTPAAVLDAREKFSLLQQWGVDPWDLAVVNPHRQKFLARLGRKDPVQALRRMGPERRSPIVVSLLKQTRIALTAARIDIFDVCMASRHKKARQALEDSHPEGAETTHTSSQLLPVLGDVVRDDMVRDARRRQVLYQHSPRYTLPAAVQEASTLRRPKGHLDFLDDPYRYIRQVAPQFLSPLAFQSQQDAHPVRKAVEVLRCLNASKRRKLPAEAPGDFVPDRWRRLVRSHAPPARRPYELCALSTLRDQRRSGDIYLPNRRRYTAPETFLIPRSTGPALRQDVCPALALAPPGAQRLGDRAPDLRPLRPRVDSLLARRQGIWMAHGDVMVPMDAGHDLPESAKALAEPSSRRIPHVDLTDWWLEVDQWPGFSPHRKHATGGQPRTDDLLRPLHAAVVAQGTHMGPVEMAHSTNRTYDRLALASFWYWREETLQAAVPALVHFPSRQPLAQYGGGGTLSSSEGQRCPVRGKVRNARARPRY